MKKFWIQFVTLIIVIVGSIYLAYNASLITPYLGSQQNLTQKSLKVGNTLVNIELADTAAKRSQGLSNRESLDSSSGMLFVFGESKKYQFWMKAVKFNLDMIFINNNQVVDILKNVPAPTPGQKDGELPIYEPVVPVNMVLEVNSGFVDTNQIKIGDKVSLINP